ncbi:MAG: protein kinase [Elusimicrobiales bacterium]
MNAAFAILFCALNLRAVWAYSEQCEALAKAKIVSCCADGSGRDDCINAALKEVACMDYAGDARLRGVLSAYYNKLKAEAEQNVKPAQPAPADLFAKLSNVVFVKGRYSQALRGAQSALTGAAPASPAARVAEKPHSPSTEQSAGPAPVSHADYQKSLDHAAKAGIKLALKDYSGARREASAAIDADPSNRAAYLVRAQACNHLHRYEDAESDASFVLKSEPLNATAYTIRSWAAAQRGDAAAARADADRAIQSDPGMAEAYYNRARVSEKTGNYRQTLEDMREASRIDKSYQTRFRSAAVRYKTRAEGFDFTSAGLSDGADQVRSAPGPLHWRRLYTLIAALAAGALILMQLVKALRSRSATRERAPSPSAAPPLFVNQFALVRKIGEGGMGEVYEGFDKTLKRKVAIKKLKTSATISDESREQLLNEARTVAVLRHPNIVEIYSVFEDSGSLFLVFEYVEGMTLDALLERDGRLPLDEAVKIFRPICRALDYAHENSIIHRDLKPGNIMISSSGVVKVMDFGVARQLDARRGEKTCSGTPAYMSPEQRAGAVSRESDIYSLGICLYETLTGHLPSDLQGFDPARNRITPPSSVAPFLPPEADRLLESALDPDPEARISSASQFWAMLEAVKQQEA